jgi:hypothetical protein
MLLSPNYSLARRLRVCAALREAAERWARPFVVAAFLPLPSVRKASAAWRSALQFLKEPRARGGNARLHFQHFGDGAGHARPASAAVAP